MKPEDVGPMVANARRIFSDFGSMPMPTIVALDGGAYGGGLEISLAADIRIAGKQHNYVCIARTPAMHHSEPNILCTNRDICTYSRLPKCGTPKFIYIAVVCCFV